MFDVCVVFGVCLMCACCMCVCVCVCVCDVCVLHVCVCVCVCVCVPVRVVVLVVVTDLRKNVGSTSWCSTSVPLHKRCTLHCHLWFQMVSLEKETRLVATSSCSYQL